MNIEKPLRTFLLADGTVNGLLGGKLYAGRIPQSVRPAIALRMRRVSTLPEYDLTAEANVTQAVIELDMVAQVSNGEATLLDLAEAIRKRMNQLHIPQTIGVNPDDLWVSGATLLRGATPIPFSPDDSSDRWRHRWSMDYLISHEQDN